MISLGHRVHMFAHPSTMERLRWCFDTVLGCGPEISLALPGLPDPVLAYRFPGGGSVSIELTTDGLDEVAARRPLRQSPDRDDEGEHPRAYSVHGSHLLARCHGLGHVANPNAASPNNFPVDQRGGPPRHDMKLGLSGGRQHRGEASMGRG
jgi:hypothetical protein